MPFLSMANPFHLANRKRWEAAADQWAERADSRGIWQRCAKKPSLVLCKRELAYLAKIKNKRACVLGSGDNQVVFALAGLGARVTSVDISQRQLDIAASRAQKLGLKIEFLRADVTDLRALKSAAFDAVYTGGHVAVWVSKLQSFYNEAARLLRSRGLLIVNEYHPFRRIWKHGSDLKIEARYLDRGPFSYELTDDVLEPKVGGFKSFEFHWTVSDFLNAITRSGCQIEEVEEYGEYVGDWEGAPMQGLPEWLLIFARKSRRV
jgi:ubiquinone/menaquinone biosynthesis C-methylase UbiE